MADEVTRICARLLRWGTLLRSELADLDFPDVRRAVEARLGSVGLVLATSAYSEHVGLRLSPEVTDEGAFDSASNLGLRSDACALLVILWARLVLQKRTAQDSRGLPGQNPLFAEDKAAAVRDYTPQVRLAALAREFGKVLGSRSHIKALVTQLRRLRFLAGHGEVIEAGPLLELAIDGERMIAFIRRGVLAQLVEEREGRAAETDDEAATAALEGRVLAAVAATGGTAAMGEIAGATAERRERLRPILRDLVRRGRLKASGERAQTRYHLVPEEATG